MHFELSVFLSSSFHRLTQSFTRHIIFCVQMNYYEKPVAFNKSCKIVDVGKCLIKFSKNKNVSTDSNLQK